MRVIFNPEIHTNIYPIRQVQAGSSVEISKKQTEPFQMVPFESFLAQKNINFTGQTCQPKDFAFKKISGLNCPCCGEKMVTNREQDKFVIYASQEKGKKLEEILTQGLEYMRPNEREITKTMIRAAKFTPGASFEDLINYGRNASISEFSYDQAAIIENVRKKAEETCNEEQMKRINQICDCTLNRIIASWQNDNVKTLDKDSEFKRKTFLKQIKSLESGENAIDSETCKKLYEIASTLPTSSNSQAAYFAKYSRRSPEEGARRLISPSLATTEHINPVSNDGANNTGNYIPLCAQCNSTRSSRPYSEWIIEHPEMPENLQNYLDQASGMIKYGQFRQAKRYSSYPTDVHDAFYAATDGKINLVVPENPKKQDLPKSGLLSHLDDPQSLAASEQISNGKQICTLKDYMHVYRKIQNTIAQQAQIAAEAKEITKKIRRLNDKKARLKRQNADYQDIAEIQKEIDRLHGLKDAIKNEQRGLAIKYARYGNQLQHAIYTPDDDTLIAILTNEEQ
ncbi:MAG: HNH endonuclease [Candidatus Gastranaerophilales bacterium]|nr:HNH endonuclease [Candidatus Gastranaerophilales bacterium]